MNKTFSTIIIIIIVCSGAASAQEPLNDKVFFANSRMPGNYFYSEATYTSPSWIEHTNGKLLVSDRNLTPGNSLSLHYTSAENGTWTAKLFYRTLRGIDFFKPATHLVFWLNVQTTTAVTELPAIGVGNKDNDSTVFVPLQKYIKSFRMGEWFRIAVPLKDLNLEAKDPDAIDAVVFRQQSADGKEHHVLIDQVELLEETPSQPLKVTPQLVSAEGFARHIDITWKPITDQAVKYIKIYRASDNKTFLPVGIQIPQISRYADFVTVDGTYSYKIALLDSRYRETPLSGAVRAATKPMDDEALLDMVQEAHFRYYWEGAEKNSGLALENIPGRAEMIASGASGFGIMALLVGAERKFITRQEAVDRFLKITAFLEKAEKFHGAFSHFINGPTGKVEAFFGPRDNGGDLVETSFLVQGLLAARQYFLGTTDSERLIRERIDRIWKNIEWDWYRQYPDSKFLFWHWSPDQAWVINHKLIGWNETMITYLLAIASREHSVPASLYYTGWASQSEEAQQYRRGWGKTNDGDHYINGNTYYGIPLKVGVSNGGPLFFVHYSFLGADPRGVSDAYTDYFSNNKAIALINYRYCIENPEKHKGYGKDCWGLTASDGLWDYSANEPVPEADEGKMTPTGALASFPYTPEQSMAALKNYYYNYGDFLWGEYGFRDAFNLDENWCGEIYMGLNQAPIVVMIENHRSGLLWNLFMKNPDIQNALKKVKDFKPESE